MTELWKVQEGLEIPGCDGRAHTAAFELDHQQGPTGQHRGLCSAPRGGPDGRGVWGRTDACICLAGSLRGSLKLPQHC